MLAGRFRCQVLLLFASHHGKETPDDGLFTKVLLRHLGRAGLEIHDLARQVISEVRLESDSQQQPVMVSTIEGGKRLFLVQENIHCIKKIDAEGLLDVNTAHEYYRFASEVTASREPGSAKWSHLCRSLHGLPHAITHFKGSNPVEVVNVCLQSKLRIEKLRGSAKAHIVPALLVLLCRFEAEARLIMVNQHDESSVSSQKQIDTLEYQRCIAMLYSLHDSYTFDPVIRAKLLSTLRYHHTSMSRHNKALEHLSQAKRFASDALPLWKTCDLHREGLFSFIDCTWGALRMCLLDKTAMEDLRVDLEQLAADPLSMPSAHDPHVSMVRCSQLAVLYKATGRIAKLKVCIKELRTVMADPVQTKVRLDMCRDLLRVWGIEN